MSRTRTTSAWSACASVASALAVACVPKEDLSSYRSTTAQPASTGVRGPAGSGSVMTGRPLLPSHAPGDAMAAIETGVPPPLAGDAALHGDEGSVAREPAGTTTTDAGWAASPWPGALVGQSRLTLDVAGVARSFLYYAPRGLDPSLPVPVLIVAHGFQESAAEMVAITGYDRVADREGFVVLYPEGQGRVPWNIGSDVCQGGAQPIPSASGDDSAFIDAMLAFVALDRAVDGEHVFFSGLASGAYLANDLACRRSDIRAVASHSGGSHALDACVEARKPVLLLHGSEDLAVPLACSVEARDRWAAHNGCGGGTDSTEVLGGVCEASLGCPENAQVTLCTFEGMGRGWAGGSAQAASFLEFAPAAELSWQFFTEFAW